MAGIMYGYARVSTQVQNEARQLAALREFGVAEENIIIEKQSGKITGATLPSLLKNPSSRLTA